MRVVVGEDARQLLSSEAKSHADGILAALAFFEPTTTTQVWMRTIRGIEEFINLMLFGLDDYPEVARALEVTVLDDKPQEQRRIRASLHYIGYAYGGDFAARVSLFLEQASIARATCEQYGITSAVEGLYNGATAVGYFMSRRRHLVALLYLLPSACKGSINLGPRTALRHLLPMVEANCATLTGLWEKLALVELHADFSLFLDPGGFSASHTYPALSSTFLEPERLPINNAAVNVSHVFTTLILVPDDRLFSGAELRRDVQLIQLAYAEFDLECNGFGPISRFIEELSWRAEDDFWINLSPSDFDRIADFCSLPKMARERLIFSGTDYLGAVNSYSAFIQIDGQLRTTVTLLSRFLYNWKNTCLYRSRRFQIRSGFEFEKYVSGELAQQGFTVTSIKRVKRKEFDVVLVREGIIYNIQCKNNLVDPEWVDCDPVRFVRVNRNLARSYERALKKEFDRAHLLQDALCLGRVESFVISRFPIVSDNERVISSTEIHKFSAKADALLMAQATR